MQVLAQIPQTQSVDCEFYTSQNGVLDIDANIKTISGLKTNTIHSWKFDAIEGDIYSFLFTDYNFYFKVIDSENKLIDNIESFSSSFSYHKNYFKCTKSGTYTLIVSPFRCPEKNFFDLKYYSKPNVIPTITGFVGQLQNVYNNITLVGFGLEEVEYISVSTVNNPKGESVYFNLINTNQIIIYNNSNNILNGKLTLIGSFGTLQSPELIFSAKTPTITGIYPTSGTIDGCISILGAGFDDVLYTYFMNNEKGNIYSRPKDKFLKVYALSGQNGVITLVGNFGTATVAAHNMFEYPFIDKTLNGYENYYGEITSLIGNNLEGIKEITYTDIKNNKSNLKIFYSSHNSFRLVADTPLDCKDGVFTFSGGFGSKVISIPELAVKQTIITSFGKNIISVGNINTIKGQGLEYIENIIYKTFDNNVGWTNIVYTNFGFDIPSSMASGFITVSGYFGLKEVPIYLKVKYPRPFIRNVVSNNLNTTLQGAYLSSVDNIYCQNKNGISRVRYWYLNSAGVIIIILPTNAISCNLTLTGGFGSVLVRQKIEPVKQNPIVNSVSKGQIRYYIEGVGLTSINSIYFQTKYGISSISVSNQFYNDKRIEVEMRDIIQGNITFTGDFFPIIVGIKNNEFCKNNTVNHQNLTILNEAQNAYLVKNMIHYWTFTGVAGNAYKFDVTESNEILIFDKYRNLLSKNRADTSLIWYCNQNDQYTLVIQRWDCYGISNFNLLTYQKIEKQPTPVIKRAIGYDKNKSILITGSGLNTISEIVFKTTEGVKLKIFLNISDDVSSTLVNNSNYFNRFIEGNLTLVGAFGVVEVPFEIIPFQDEQSKIDYKIEPINFQDLLIYPNPSYDYFYVESSVSAHLKVFNMLGVVVYESQKPDYIHSFDLPFEGQYFVDIGGVRKKIIVKH